MTFCIWRWLLLCHVKRCANARGKFSIFFFSGQKELEELDKNCIVTVFVAVVLVRQTKKKEEEINAIIFQKMHFPLELLFFCAFLPVCAVVFVST